ncbi:MAG: outer membrane protein [Pseudolabrys sp.]
MRVLKSTVLTALVVLASTAAYAADIPVRQAMPAKAVPVAPPVFTWTGFYAGVNAGWGWSDGDGTLITGGATVPLSGSGNGFLGGVQIGYNWQTGPLVFGIETDFQGSTGSGDLNGSGGGVTVSSGDLKTPWFGTIRGRLGYAWDRWMVYLTGGGAYSRVTWDGTLSTTGPFSSSATGWSWTLGGGVETMLWDRWSVKLEYLYVATPDSFPTPPGTTDMSGDTHTNIIRAGLNYHF